MSTVIRIFTSVFFLRRWNKTLGQRSVWIVLPNAFEDINLLRWQH